MAFLWFTGINFILFFVCFSFDNPASGSPTPDKQLTYNYLLAINAWLLLFPSELCCDWTMGTVPVIKSILDYRNVFTVLFYVIMFKLATFALKCQNVTNRALIMVSFVFTLYIIYFKVFLFH